MTMFNESPKPTVIRKAAIIGSGISGLTAALRLNEAGVETVLFEKSRGPGGRLASKRLADLAHGSADASADVSVDIGAQYFTVRNPSFRSFLNRYARDPDSGSETYDQWHGRLRYQASDGDWDAFHAETRYVGVPRMTAISRALAQTLDIRTGVRIERLIRPLTGQWHLNDSEGAEYGPFDAVILTVPPAQAEEIILNSHLDPLVNAFSDDIDLMQACWTVVAQYESGLGLDYEGLQPQSDVLRWAGNNSSKPGRNTSGEWWVLHGRPDWSDEHQDSPKAYVEKALLDAFSLATDTGSQPIQVHSHRWLYAKSSAKAGPGHLWFAEHQVALIGDWLSGGRVEGAFESADSLIREWKKTGDLQPRG